MSPAASELFTQTPVFNVLVNGHFGVGKTHFGMTFPKVYAICMADRGIDILYRKGNDSLRNNLVWYEYINPGTDQELREFFRPGVGGLYKILEDVKKKAELGEVQTLLFDGFTYFVDMKWRQINLDEVDKSARTGNVDTQSMYRNLGLYLQTFVARDLVPISKRYHINLVVTCHLKRESEMTLEGTQQRAGKVDKLSDIAPMIEGGFRQKVDGYFGASIYLDKKVSGNKPVYTAYCDKTNAMRTVINAKNRYGLPPVVENVNYEALMKCMDVKTSLDVKTNGTAPKEQQTVGGK